MKPVLISISLLVVLSINSFNSSADQIVKGLVTSKSGKQGLPGV